MIDSPRKTKPLKPFSLLQRVHQASRAIAAARDEPTIGQALMGFAASGDVHAARLLIFNDDPAKGGPAVEMREGWTIDDRPARPYGTLLPLDEYPLLEYMMADELLVCENVKTDERLNEPTRVLMAVSGLESFGVIPLTSTVTDSWLGAVIVGRDTPSAFDKEFVYAWWALAGQAAAALENLRLLQRVEQDRQRYWDLYNHAPDCYFSIGPDGALLEFNDTGLLWLGYERQDVIGKMRTPDILASHSRPAFLAVFPQLKAQGRISDVEIEFQRRDGTIFPVLIDATALYDSDGKFLRGRTIARDITARRTTEAALRESETKHRLLLNNILSPILAVQDDMTILYCNPAYADLVALPVHELEGANLLRVFPDFEKTESYAAFMQALKSGRNQIATDLLDKRYIQANIYRTPWGILSVAQDVTEREQAATEREHLLKDLGKRALQLQTAAEVSRAASSIIDLNELLQQVVDLICERFGLYYAGIFLIDEQGDWAVLRAGTGEAGRTQIERQHKLQVGGESMIGQCVITAQAQIALDVGEEPYRFNNPYLPATRSEMALPLINRGQVIGAMTIQSTQEAAFSSEDISILQTMADQIANAIQNARLYQEQQQHAKKLADLHAVSVELAQEQQDLDTVLDIISRRTMSLLDADGAGVWRWRADDQELELIYTIQVGDVAMAGRRLKPGEGLSGRAFAEGALQVVEDYLAWTGHTAKFDDAPFFSALAAPMVWQGQTIGVLAITRSQPGYPFTANEQHLAELMAGQSAAVIQNTVLFQQVQRQLQDLTVLLDTSAAVSTSLDVDRILHTTAEHITRALAADGCAISTWDKEQDLLTTRLDYTRSPDAAGTEATGTTYSLVDYPASRRLLTTRQPLVVQASDPDADPAEIEWMSDQGITSLLLVPLIVRDQAIGLLELVQAVQSGERVFTPDQIALCQALSNQVAAALENARLFEERSQRAEELAALNTVAIAASRSLETQTLLDAALDAVLKALDYDAGLISLYDEPSACLYLAAQRRVPEPMVKHFEQHGLAGTLCDVVFQTGNTVHIADIMQGAPVDVRGLIQQGLRAYVGAPIAHQDKILGTICLFHRSVYELSAARLGQLEAIGRQLGVGVANARLFESAQRASTEQERRAEELRVINELGQALTAILDIDQVLYETYRGVSRLLDTTNFYIGLYDAETHQTTFRLNITESEIDKEITTMSTDRGITGYIIRTRASVLIPEDIPGWLKQRGLESVGQPAACWLGTPLMVGDRVIGVMAIQDYHTPHLYDEHDRDIFVTIANQAAVAIQNARLFDETRRRVEEQSTLAEMGRTLTAMLDIETIVENIYQYTARLMDATNFYVARYDPETEEVTFPLAIENGERVPWRSRRLGKGLTERVIHGREPILIPENIFQWLARQGIEAIGAEAQSWLGVPMMIGQQVSGVIAIQSYTTPRLYNKRDQDALIAIANQAAIAIQNAHLFEQAQAALAEVETTHRRYLRAQWEGMLGATPGRVWGYVDGPAGLTPADSLWTEEIEQAITTGESVTLTRQPGPEPSQPDVREPTRLSSSQAQSNDVPAPSATQRSALAVPIRLRGQTIGVLDFYDEGGARRWTDDDKALVEALADQIAQALETQRLFEQTQRRAYRERLTGEIAGKIRAAGDVHGILETAAEELGRALGVSRTLIRLNSPTDGPPQASH